MPPLKKGGIGGNPPRIVGGRGETKRTKREATRGVAQVREKARRPPCSQELLLKEIGRLCVERVGDATQMMQFDLAHPHLQLV